MNESNGSRRRFFDRGNVAILLAGSVIAAGSFATAIVCAEQPAERAAAQPSKDNEGGKVERTRRAGRVAPRGNDADAPPEAPEGFRAFLEQRLEQGKKEEGRIKDAMERLNKGEPPSDVMREFRREGEPRFRQMREFMDGREGRGGPGGPDGPGEATGEGGPGGRGMGGPPVQLTPTERDRLIEAIKSDAPVLAERLTAMRNADPESVDRMMTRMSQRIRDAVATRKRDPELFRVKLREIEEGMLVMDAARDRRVLVEANAEKPKIEEATGKLREAVVRQLDSRLAAQAREIELLESRLKDQKEALEQQRSGKSEKVDEILRRIAEEPKHDGSPRGGPSRK